MEIRHFRQPIHAHLSRQPVQEQEDIGEGGAPRVCGPRKQCARDCYTRYKLCSNISIKIWPWFKARFANIAKVMPLWFCAISALRSRFTTMALCFRAVLRPADAGGPGERNSRFPPRSRAGATAWAGKDHNIIIITSMFK